MISFRVLKSFDSGIIAKLIKLEIDNLGREAAINQWQLPVIIRYGKFVVAENEPGDIIGVCEMLRQWGPAGQKEQMLQEYQAGQKELQVQAEPAGQTEQIEQAEPAGKTEQKEQDKQEGRTGYLPIAFIHSFYIEEAFRHRGIGKNLLENVIDILKKDGFKSVQLTVAPDNEPALNLYTRFGFEKKMLEIGEYGEGQDRFLMELVFDGE